MYIKCKWMSGKTLASDVDGPCSTPQTRHFYGSYVNQYIHQFLRGQRIKYQFQPELKSLYSHGLTNNEQRYQRRHFIQKLRTSLCLYICQL